MSGISALVKETPGSSLAPSAGEDSWKRWSAVSQEVGSHQTLFRQIPRSQASHLQTREK